MGKYTLLFFSALALLHFSTTAFGAFELKAQKNCNLSIFSDQSLTVGENIKLRFSDGTNGTAAITSKDKENRYKARINDKKCNLNVTKIESDKNSIQNEDPDDTSTLSLRSRSYVNATADFGLLVGSVPGPEFEIDYNLWRLGQIGVSYGFGELSLPKLENQGYLAQAYKISTSLILVKYRQYLMNSFNISASLGSRALHIGANIKSTTSLPGSFNFKWDGTSYGLGFAIGNRWTASFGLTWGID